MDKQLLRESLRPVARAVRTASERQREASVFAAFDDAGGVKSEALRRSLPPSMLVAWLPGVATTGSNVHFEVELAGAVRLTHLAVRAKVAPTGSQYTARLTANGAEVVTASMPPGMSHGRSAVPADTAVRAAGEVLRLDVVSAGAAEDVTVTVSYTVASE